MVERRFPMSALAYQALEDRKNIVQAESDESHRNLGEAGDDDWHGEFAFEHYQRESSMYRARLADLQALLTGAEIVPMRTETDVVGLYNDVVILFDGDEDPERYTIAERADVFAQLPGTISSDSTLGKNLLGKKKGEEVEFVVEQGTQKFQQKVRIVDIEPGSLTAKEIFNESEASDSTPQQ